MPRTTEGSAKQRPAATKAKKPAARKAAQKPATKPKAPRGAAKVNATTGAFLVSDARWEKLAPLLPVPANTHRFGGGRPRPPDRRCAESALRGRHLPGAAHRLPVERAGGHGALAYDELRGRD